jgi:hypothetical protein
VRSLPLNREVQQQHESQQQHQRNGSIHLAWPIIRSYALSQRRDGLLCSTSIKTHPLRATFPPCPRKQDALPYGLCVAAHLSTYVTTRSLPVPGRRCAARGLCAAVLGLHLLEPAQLRFVSLQCNRRTL